jgi:hypothetical protein
MKLHRNAKSTPTCRLLLGSPTLSAKSKSSLQDLLAAGALILGDPAFKRYYRIGELAAMWQLGCETVRLLVKDERGVIKIRLGRGSCCGEPARGAGPRACDGRAG